jgi:glycosyltransferase involved in cell wall biosynthesis
MKVALVHDWLNTKFGGGERMLAELAAMYPDAPIYTLICNPEVLQYGISADRVRTSFLQRMPHFLRQRSRYLLPLIPIAIEQFDLSEYDVVISTSSAFAKGVITKPETLHICYCFSPMRFVWDHWPAYLNEQKVGPVRRAAIRLVTSRLRLWDFYSAARVDRWVAISKTVAGRIRKFYHQEADVVIYPGADLSTAKPIDPKLKEDYFVTLAALTPYKRIDLAVAACTRLNKRLIVMGDGPERARLEAMAGPTIEFTGRVDDRRRGELVAAAAGLIFPNEEDFGIAPIDAMASGTAVIAYGKGGLTETVVPGTTGVFFDEPTVESLSAAIADFKTTDYATADLVAQAKKFSMERFRTQMAAFVKEQYRESK